MVMNERDLEDELKKLHSGLTANTLKNIGQTSEQFQKYHNDSMAVQRAIEFRIHTLEKFANQLRNDINGRTKNENEC